MPKIGHFFLRLIAKRAEKDDRLLEAIKREGLA